MQLNPVRAGEPLQPGMRRTLRRKAVKPAKSPTSARLTRPEMKSGKLNRGHRPHSPLPGLASGAVYDPGLVSRPDHALAPGLALKRRFAAGPLDLTFQHCVLGLGLM